MKKITLLIVLMITSLGFAQDPATGPQDPIARNSTDVKSIYNGIASPIPPQYTNEPNGDFQNFGGSTIVGPVTLADGNTVMKYTNHLYSGIQAGAGNLDVTGMTKLHIDVYSPGFTSFRIKLEAANGSNIELDVPGAHVQGTWNSYDLDLSTYAGVDLAHLKWIVPVTYTPPGETLYIDNVYFYRVAVDPLKDATLSDLKVAGTTISSFNSSVINYTYEVPSGTVIVPQITSATTSNGAATKVITQASAIPGSATVLVTSADATTTKTYTISIVAVGPSSAAPTPPARASSDVVSIYSDAYTNIAVDNFDAGWCGGAATTAVTVAGNNTLKKNTGVACHGIDFSTKRQNLTSFTYLHFDFYITDADLTGDVFNVKLVNFNGGSGESSALEVNINVGTTPQLVANQWVSVDVPITALGGVVANSLARNDIAQIGITTANVTNVWYDNIYLHKGTVLGTEKFETSSVKMYPNPIKNTLTIDANSAIQKISVYNILGQEVLKASPKTNSVTLQTNELKKGVYMVTTEIDGKVSTSKVIKE